MRLTSLLLACLSLAGCADEPDVELAAPVEEPGAPEISGPVLSEPVPTEFFLASPAKSLAEIQASNEAILARARRQLEEGAPPGPTIGDISSSPSASDRSQEKVIADALEAIVRIERRGAMGSGFFIEPGVIVTNLHVIGKTRLVDVVIDGTKHQARLLQSAPKHDLVLLELYETDPSQKVLPLGSIDGVEVGEEVFAIGSALALNVAATRGIVSAIRTAHGVTYVQTDAAINPGNSGGPLLDREGRVIGINTATLTNADRVGFAVAADHAFDLRGGIEAMTPLRVADQTNDETLANIISPPSRSRGSERTAADVFKQQIRSLARQADQFDAEYGRFRRDCRAQINNYGGKFRPTIALARAPAVFSGRNECISQHGSLRGRASRIVQGVWSAAKKAKESGMDDYAILYIVKANHLYW